ncbi:hypothetical protein BBP40_004997 [Aspergillus hancockii]|nr:hypothetical protein BBP40_004997 [Aspergillus hancockii]
MVFVLATAVYRIYFHPLRDFPGPKLVALTSLYEFYFTLIKDGQFVWEIGRLRDEYGSIVRITPNELHIIDASYYNEIYAGSFRVTEKDPSFVRFFGVPESMIATIGHSHHNLRRKILNKFFSKRSISNIQKLIRDKIEGLMGHFTKAHREKSVVNLYVAFSSLTADIISNDAYGTDYCFLDDVDRPNDVKVAAESLGPYGHILRLLPFDSPRLRRIPLNVMENFLPRAAKVTRLQERIGQQSKEAMSEQDTLFASLNDPSLPAAERTLDWLQDEGFVLLGAGTETTSWALSTIMFYILKDKYIFFQLHEEVKAVMPQPNDVPNLSELETLPLLV